jgi:hypothetical protein
MPLAMTGQAFKRFDELLPVFGGSRHAWSFLPARQGIRLTFWFVLETFPAAIVKQTGGRELRAIVARFPFKLPLPYG